MSETDLIIKLGRRILARLRPSKKKLSQAIKPEVFSTAGYKIETFFFKHDDSNRPTLIICVDFPDTVASVLEGRYPFPCAETFALGYNIIIFDPAGRGASWGTEDYGGLEHQDNLHTMLQWAQQNGSSSLGVISIGCGLSMALGGISSFSGEVLFLLDFEGPSDEEFLRTYYPLSPKKMDEHFWKERSPIQLFSNFSTRYIRLQAEKDHLCAYDMRHCNRIFRQLKNQNHKQFQLNDHPMGQYPPQPQLLVADKRVIEKKFVEVLKGFLP